jgi:TonB family protein
MNRPLATILAISLACCVSFAASAEAVNLGKKWAGDLQRTEQLLRAGEYAQARKATRKIAQEMVDAMGPGDKAETVLGLVLTFRGLAEAGLGDRRAALWYWHVALNFDPSLQDLDLRAFGEHGEFLKAHPLRDHDADARCAEYPAGPDCGRDADGVVVEAPRVRKRPRPVYPYGARAFRESGQLVVQVVIGEDGSVSSPRVMEALPAPTLSYVALEAIREWEFEPARRAGEPVAVCYNLTVNYVLRR